MSTNLVIPINCDGELCGDCRFLYDTPKKAEKGEQPTCRLLGLCMLRTPEGGVLRSGTCIGYDQNEY
jgi:hypothetical protein